MPKTSSSSTEIPSLSDPAVEGLSGGSSTDSSTAEGGFFAGDAGPAFDPSSAPDVEPAVDPKATASDVAWDQARVRYLLESTGQAAHAVLAVDPDSDEWRMTQDDLRAITPPLTNILNRYQPTKAAAAAGDEAALAIGLGGYIFRSYVERKAALERQAMGQPQPAPAPAPAEEAYVDDAGLVSEDDVLPTPPLSPRR